MGHPLLGPVFSGTPTDWTGLLSLLALREEDSFVEGGGDREEVVDLGGFEELQDAGIYAGSHELNAPVLAADEVADDEAEAAGVHVWHAGEVEDVDGCRMAWAGFGLEELLEGGGTERCVHVAGGKRARKAEDDGIWKLRLRCCQDGAFDVEIGGLPDLSGNGSHESPLWQKIE